MRLTMTYSEARDVAAKFGARLPKYAGSAAVADCWIDRIEWLPAAAALGAEELAAAIEEADLCAGR